MTRVGAVIAGLICLDVIPALPDQGLESTLRPGQTTESGPISFHTGGAVANTGIALFRLGIPVHLVGLVGDDAVGNTIRQLVREDDAGLADGLRVVPGTASPCTIVLSPPASDRAFITFPGTNHTFGADDVPYDRLSSARLFHFGYPPYMQRMYSAEGDELLVMFRRAKAAGVLTSLDMAYPEARGASGRANWRQILSRVLPFVDLFLPSADELWFMLHGEDQPAHSIPQEVVSRLASEALEMGAAVVGLKVGERGFYVRTGDSLPAELASNGWQKRELWAPCFKATTVTGTTGAGDATIAGLLAGIHHDLSPEEALTAAVAVGACCVEAPDALSGIKSWPETQARIKAGWPRVSLHLNGAGWRWNRSSALWVGPGDSAH